jgi:rod shape determining protein RodA
MFQHDRLNNEITLFQKIKNLDYILLISVILLSVLSVFVMYSTDGGEILFHTKNHFVKLAVFFPLMIFVAFFNIKFWHNFSYIIYFYSNTFINLCFIFWNKVFWFTKMDGSLFICSATFRTYESSNHNVSCKILS